MVALVVTFPFMLAGLSVMLENPDRYWRDVMEMLILYGGTGLALQAIWRCTLLSAHNKPFVINLRLLIALLGWVMAVILVWRITELITFCLLVVPTLLAALHLFYLQWRLPSMSNRE